jgi:serine/threonine protein kinase
MGEVYRARDSRLARDVALKILPCDFATDSDRRARFEREARAAGQIHHPNILTILDIGAHDALPFIVTELLEGETLRERLRPGPLPQRKAMEITSQIAKGLGAAHERGIVHRDIKPENTFISSNGHVKILDFGLSSVSTQESAPSDSTITLKTASGIILGTAAYMSPEQARGHAVDSRSDIFSLGSVLYEMLSGQRPFKGNSYADLISAILREDPAPLPSELKILPALDRIVRRCLEKSPAERFQSARDLAFQLDSLVSNIESGSGAVVPDLHLGRWSAFSRIFSWVAVPAMILATAVLAWWFRGWQLRNARPPGGCLSA